MPTRCVVAGCSNTPKQGVSVHRFPKDEGLRKIWAAKVRLTRAKWAGPSPTSVICSAHFTADDFVSSLYTQFGISKGTRLKNTAIPTKIRVSSTTVEKPKRRSDASAKREKRRMLEELLQESSSDSPDDLDAEVPMAMDVTPLDSSNPDDEHEPGCSDWMDSSQHCSLQSSGFVSHTDTFSTESITAAQSIGCQTVTVTVATQTDKVATRIKRIQATECMVDKGMQCDPISTTSTETLCMLLDDRKKDSSYDDPDEIVPEKPESPAYSPDSSSSSSEYLSTPQKATNKPLKRRKGRSPRTVVDFKSVGNSDVHRDTKYLVCASRLLKLFERCSGCLSFDVTVKERVMGTLVTITQDCNTCNRETNTWESQPWFGNIPSVNVLFSAAILFAGGSCATTLRIFNFLKIATIGERAFFRHQSAILQPVVERLWKAEQRKLMEEMKAAKQPLTIGGDGRADSPGHSAKFGAYTAVELNHKKIIDIQLVQSNEVKNSNNMELEGFKRMVKKLRKADLSIGKLVTDRHRQLAKYVREELPTILHVISSSPANTGDHDFTDCALTVDGLRDNRGFLRPCTTMRYNNTNW